MGVKNEVDEMCEKSCGLSFDSPLLRRKNALFFDESRVQVCRSGHALVHHALSEFEILAFTLHLHR